VSLFRWFRSRRSTEAAVEEALAVGRGATDLDEAFRRIQGRKALYVIDLVRDALREMSKCTCGAAVRAGVPLGDLLALELRDAPADAAAESVEA
jgi:hypothetical protein